MQTATAAASPDSKDGAWCCGEELPTVTVFGPAGAALPLAILTAGQLVNCAFGSATALLNMTNNEKWNTLAFGGAMAVNLALAILLVPRFGGTGAAVAAAISVVLRNCLLWTAARKLTGIDTGFWAKI